MLTSLFPERVVDEAGGNPNVNDFAFVRRLDVSRGDGAEQGRF